MFAEEMGQEDPHKDMKIKLLDDLIEKIMSMGDEPAESEKPGLEISVEKGPIDSSTEMSQEDDKGMKDKLASLKGI